MQQAPPQETPGPTPLRLDRAMLAHDVRGALQGVMGGVAILDGAELDPQARAQIDRVSAAARNLSHLVSALLGDDAGDDDEAQRIETGRFLRHLSRRWSGEAVAKGLRLRVEAQPGTPGRLDVDRVTLARALGNLIGNAIKYSGRGEVVLEAGPSPGGGLTLSVRDEGPGLPAETLEKLSRPASPAPAGTIHGLGLEIVRAFCAEMGASFVMANRPRGGAEARVTFPPSVCGEAAGARRAEAADLTGLRVLLAEDNPTNQIVACQMLRALNASVTLSSDGVEAMERYENAEFDLVVVDIEMPRMTGLDVIRAIRSRSDGRDSIPIVALTAYAMREHRDRIAAAGANGLISKPITSVDALGSALLAHVSPRRAASPPRFEEDAARPPDEPVANLEIYDALCSAIGMGMMAELLEKVVADLMQARRDLAGALEPLDRRPIRSASHILISVAGAIGATRLQACARALNNAAHGEDARNLPADVRRCLGEIDAAVGFAVSRQQQVGGAAS